MRTVLAVIVMVLAMAAAVRPQPRARPIQRLQLEGLQLEGLQLERLRVAGSPAAPSQGSPVEGDRVDGFRAEVDVATSRRARRWWMLPTARSARPEPAELAVWCDALARSLRGGGTLHHALRTVHPPPSVRGRLEPAMLALERGASVSGALAAVEPSSPDLALVLVVLQTCAEQGGAPAEPIDRAATALRQRAALAAERQTQSAPARMSAVVMTSLPGAMLAVLLATSAAVRAVVVTPIGLLVLAAGAVLNLAGWCWMRHLVNSGPT